MWLAEALCRSTKQCVFLAGKTTFFFHYHQKKCCSWSSRVTFNSDEKTFPTENPVMGCRDGAVVRALDSHQCGLGSIPRSGVVCGLSLLVLFSAPRGFLQVLRFPLSSKISVWLDLCQFLISVYTVSPISAPALEPLAYLNHKTSETEN